MKNDNLNGKIKIRIKVPVPKKPGIYVYRERLVDPAQEKKARIALQREGQLAALDVAAKGITWLKLLEKYEIANRDDIRPGNTETTFLDRIAVLHQFTKHWYDIEAESLKARDVKRLIDSAVDMGFSRSRVKWLRGSLNTVFNWGILDGCLYHMNRSPVEGVNIGREFHSKPPLILNRDEIEKFLNAARDLEHPWFYHWAFALNSGMRSGELFALLWSDIDEKNALINVEKSYCSRSKKIKSTKTGMWRKIPINSQLSALLVELRELTCPSQYVLPKPKEWARGEAAKVLRDFLSSIGVTPVTFHCLRACFATQLLQAGIPIPTVQKIGGWESLKVMQKYIRLAGIDIAGGTDALNFIRPKDAIEGAVVNMADYRLTSMLKDEKPE